MDQQVLETAAAPVAPEIDAVLRQLVGQDALVTDPAALTFYSTDISGTRSVCEAVVRVSDVETLRRVVQACTMRGYQVIPRGGGFSYTGGYTPTSPRSVIVDMRPMDRIVEINVEDMYVVVEAGCTWRALYEALKAQGVRTPYFGPMSGYNATVGGALSQGSFFLGSSQYGPVSDSVLGLEVVLADGRLLRTGSWGGQDSSPFFRQYGPDATGLFLNDTGAMGFKTRAALRLIRFPAHQAYGSFAFTNHGDAVRAVSELGRSDLCAECYCWDPHFVRVMAGTRAGLGEDLTYLWNVVRAGGGVIDGLLAAARIALAGRRVLDGQTWLLHVVVDQASAAGATAALGRVRKLATAAGGKEVSPSAPRTLRGTPFTNFNTAERRTSLRNLPTHGLTPHSSAAAVADEIYALLKRRKADLVTHGVECGLIFFAVGAQAVCVEPLTYWRDERHFLHNRVEQTSDVAALQASPDLPEGTRFALELRDDFKAIFKAHRCAHMQIGRSYPWAVTRQETTLSLLSEVKAWADPEDLMNPGSLGLGRS